MVLPILAFLLHLGFHSHAHSKTLYPFYPCMSLAEPALLLPVQVSPPQMFRVNRVSERVDGGGNWMAKAH
jgi:hypothetical protein